MIASVAATLFFAAAPALVAAAPLAPRDGYRFTYYDTSVGLGACGILHQNNEYTVAMNAQQYSNSQCGDTIWISYGGKTASATIQDECPGCPYGGLDLSEGLFSYFADQSVGVIYGSWGFGSSGGAATTAAATTTKAAVTTTKAAAPTTAETPTTTATPTTTKTSTKAATTYTPTTTVEHDNVEPTTSSKAAVSSTKSSAVHAAASASTSAWTSSAPIAVNVTALCPGSKLLILQDDNILLNGTYHNGTFTNSHNGTQAYTASSFVNATSLCFNSTVTNLTSNSSSPLAVNATRFATASLLHFLQV